MDETPPDEVMNRVPHRLKDGMSMADLRQQFAGKPITTQETQSSISVEEPVDERTKELKKALVDQLQDALNDTSLSLDMQKKLQQTLSDLQGAHTRSAILAKAPFAREVISQVKAQSGREASSDGKLDNDPIKQLSAQINDAWHRAQDCGYVTKQEEEAHQKQQDAIDAMMEEYNQLPADSPAKKALAVKLNRAIEKAYQHDISKMQELEQKALADGKPELAAIFQNAVEAEKERKEKREDEIDQKLAKQDFRSKNHSKNVIDQSAADTVYRSNILDREDSQKTNNLLTEMITNIPAMPKPPLANILYEHKELPVLNVSENQPPIYAATVKTAVSTLQAKAKDETTNASPSLDDLGTLAPPFPKRSGGKGGREI